MTYDYDAAGHMTAVRQYGSTLLASWEFDGFGRTVWVSYGSATHSVAASWSPDDDLLTYANDLAGTAYDVGYTNIFTPAKQIASAAISNNAFVYFQTVASTTPYTVNGLNQYTNVDGQAPSGTTCGGASQAITYDCNGNLTADGTYTFTYDVENRLTGAGKSGLTASYAYDPLGRRYQKAVTGGSLAGTTLYLNSGDDEIAEYGGPGKSLSVLVKRYIPGPSGDRPIAMIDSVDTAPVTKFFYTDRQGSVTVMSDAAGAKTDSGPFTYDAYGNCKTGTSLCSDAGVPFRYTGRRYDAETGLYYYRARFYSPKLGRFLQTDPIGYKDDLNWYAYVGNDPTDKTDPTGLQEQEKSPMPPGFEAYGPSGMQIRAPKAEVQGIMNSVKEGGHIAVTVTVVTPETVPLVGGQLTVGIGVDVEGAHIVGSAGGGPAMDVSGSSVKNGLAMTGDLSVGGGRLSATGEVSRQVGALVPEGGISSGASVSFDNKGSPTDVTLSVGTGASVGSSTQVNFKWPENEKKK